MRRFGLEEFAEVGITPRFNIAPSQLVPIIVDTPRAPEMRIARWGLVPPWQSGPAKAPPPINARVETLTERASFRSALRYQRCLIPADGFYEWKTAPGGRGSKQPMYIRLKDGGMFAFAGLYAKAHPDNPAEDTCVIITAEASERMADIHHRMPVIVQRSDEKTWLDRRENRTAEVLKLLGQNPGAEIEAFAVSQRVGSPDADDADLIQPEAEQPFLF
jgi:putative SOS response-associated peptidase YedK